jgi:hypothetical protein
MMYDEEDLLPDDIPLDLSQGAVYCEMMAAFFFRHYQAGVEVHGWTGKQGTQFLSRAYRYRAAAHQMRHPLDTTAPTVEGSDHDISP